MKGRKMKNQKMMPKEQIPIKNIKTTLVEINKTQDADVDRTYWGWEVGEMDIDELETALMYLEIVKNIIVEKYNELIQEYFLRSKIYGKNCKKCIFRFNIDLLSSNPNNY